LKRKNVLKLQIGYISVDDERKKMLESNIISGKSDLEIVAFKSQKEWERWLSKNHSKSTGVWFKFFKKDSGIKSVNYNEALDGALSFGWIDSQAKKFDDKSWIQRFTPRRPANIWSKRNIDNIERLMKAGKMKPAGLKEVEKAKSDGRWEKAYDSPKNMKVPEDFLKELSKNKKAKTFFETLNKTNIYSIAWRLQTAKKPETRARRINVIIEMLREGKKYHE